MGGSKRNNFSDKYRFYLIKLESGVWKVGIGKSGKPMESFNELSDQCPNMLVVFGMCKDKSHELEAELRLKFPQDGKMTIVNDEDVFNVWRLAARSTKIYEDDGMIKSNIEIYYDDEGEGKLVYNDMNTRMFAVFLQLFG